MKISLLLKFSLYRTSVAYRCIVYILQVNYKKTYDTVS